jgi:hypothetical protein
MAAVEWKPQYAAACAVVRIMNNYTVSAFTLGAAVPLTSFVQMQTVTE